MTDPSSRLAAALADRYAIERELGEGGMATVFLARDLKHNRHVALKVLKPELAAVVGADRFLAEIETTANLQHPHILPLFDSGRADGFLFYVMPFVQGETLRQRLDREKQLPVEDAVEIAVKVAGALHAAHGRGVIHRDIKPANILLGEGGEPLVADFGIALAVQQAGGGRLTETGLSLGTPYYMSPEQATADRDPDARSDVYALACVLFEMLAGDPPHQASTAQATIARILTDEAAPVSRHRKAVPENVTSAIARGLEKVPADRFPTAAGFAQALTDPGFRWRSGGEGASASAANRMPWGLTALIAGVTLVVGALVGRTLGDGEAVVVPPSYRVTLDADLPSTGTVGVTLAGDGRLIHQDHPSGADTEILNMPFVVRRPGAVDPTVLTGTEGGIDGALSPDGLWFAYRDEIEGRIARVPTDGGAPVALFTWEPGAHEIFWPWSWSGDDRIYGSLLGLVGPSWVARLRAADGVMERLFEVEEGLSVSGVEILPGDRRVVFDIGRPIGDSDVHIFTLDLESGDTTYVVDGSGAQWSPSGHLVYAHRGSLFAIPFDPASGRPTGTALSLGIDLDAPRVLRWPRLFDVSVTGSMAYVAHARDWTTSERIVIASGDSAEVLPLRPSFGQLRYAVSPDGERIAYADTVGIVVQNLRTGAVDELTLAQGRGLPGTGGWSWSDDGEVLALGDLEASALHFHTEGDGTPDLTSIDLESGFAEPTDWLDDERILASWRPTPDVEVETDIVIIDRRTGAIEPVLSGEWKEAGARVSPSGRWIAYETLKGEERRIVVRSFPDLGPEVEVTRDDRALAWSTWYPIGPFWDYDEDAIYYWEAGAVSRAEVAEGPGGPRLIDRTRVFTLDHDDRLFGVHPDGRVLVGLFFEGDEEEPRPRLMLVTDLAREITAREGGGR